MAVHWDSWASGWLGIGVAAHWCGWASVQLHVRVAVHRGSCASAWPSFGADVHRSWGLCAGRWWLLAPQGTLRPQLIPEGC